MRTRKNNGTYPSPPMPWQLSRSLLGVLAAGLALAGCATRSDHPVSGPGASHPPAVMRNGFICEAPPFPASHASTIVETRRGIMAAHRQPAYAGSDAGSLPLPVTEQLSDNTLILPVFHQLTDAELAQVVDALVGAAKGSAGVAA